MQSWLHCVVADNSSCHAPQSWHGLSLNWRSKQHGLNSHSPILAQAARTKLDAALNLQQGLKSQSKQHALNSMQPSVCASSSIRSFSQFSIPATLVSAAWSSQCCMARPVTATWPSHASPAGHVADTDFQAARTKLNRSSTLKSLFSAETSSQ